MTHGVSNHEPREHPTVPAGLVVFFGRWAASLQPQYSKRVAMSVVWTAARGMTSEAGGGGVNLHASPTATFELRRLASSNRSGGVPANVGRVNWTRKRAISSATSHWPGSSAARLKPSFVDMSRRERFFAAVVGV